MRPLLLLDVDGVLNPEDATTAVLRRYGYQRQVLRATQPQTGSDIYLTYDFNPAHVEMLHRLMDHFEMTWCTTWHESANESLSPLYGLPQLPVVNIRTSEPTHRAKGELSHKTMEIIRYVGDRPFIWVDNIVRRADRNFFREILSQPAVGYLIPKEIGLQYHDVDWMVDWAVSLGD